MGVVVFDADVLIGFLNADDAHHADAVATVRTALGEQRRLLCAVNYSEVLIGPLRVGRPQVVDAMLGHFAVEVVGVDRALAERAAAVRARTGLELPDAYALATAVHAEERGHRDVRLATFDEKVIRAHAGLRPDR